MNKLSYMEFTKTNIMCEFIIDGDDFEPEIISKRLEIKPSKVKIKGDESPINNFSAWELSTGYNIYMIKERNVII